MSKVVICKKKIYIYVNQNSLSKKSCSEPSMNTMVINEFNVKENVS